MQQRLHMSHRKSVVARGFTPARIQPRFARTADSARGEREARNGGGRAFRLPPSDIDIPQAPLCGINAVPARWSPRLSACSALNRQQPFRPAGGSQCSLLLPDEPAILFCQRAGQSRRD